MQCDICQRHASSKLPFNCTICARDILYQPRLNHAQILLEKESLEKQIEQNVSGGSKPSKSSNPAAREKEANPTWTVQRASADQNVSEEQTQVIQSHIDILRHETHNMKVDIAARKTRLLRRRAELASAQGELSHSQSTAQEPLEKSIRRTNHRWDILHAKTAESRLFLCKEAAHLYGLQQHKRKKGTRGRDVYTIGGTPVIDLRDLNNASPSEITVSTTHLAHLLHLASHYLSLKLPAEITLPHRDYPSPTILSPHSSYTTNHPIPFPGSTLSASPSASRHHNTTTNKPNDPSHRPLPRPRLLHLDKPLPTLAKDDPLAYATFVEAITFLAWDLAWLCRTQGLPIGANSWEDICAMGRNLYQLLLAPPSAPARPPLPPSAPSSTFTKRKEHLALSPHRKPATPATQQKDKEHPPPFQLPPPAHFSHATTYAPLFAASGSDYMRSWRLASAVKAVERVKAMLLAERTGAEWEILEGEEWLGAEEEQREGEGGGREGDTENGIEDVRLRAGVGMGETGILVKGRAGADLRVGGDVEREKANGWMKVKSRSSNAEHSAGDESAVKASR